MNHHVMDGEIITKYNLV